MSDTFQTRIHKFDDILLKNFVLPPIFDTVKVTQDDHVGGICITGIKDGKKYTIANISTNNGGGIIMAPICP